MSWLDNLECECFFLNSILNKKFKDYLKQNNVNENEYEKGYYMLIELTINNLIHSMECLISDDLDELISWSGNLTSKHLDKNIKTKSKDIDFIKGLEGFRKKIEDKRLNKSKSDLDNIINNFLKKIKEIQKYYFNNTKYKKNKDVKKENVFLFLIANSKP